MSRSSLSRIFRQLYQINRYSQKTGIPVDELTQMWQEKRRTRPNQISRRRFLQGGLAVGSAIAATHFSRPPIMAQENAPVLIVGAGIAGLTAAYRLQQAGVAVDLIEARERVGGRIYTLENAFKTGVPVELGAEFINTDHTFLRSLADELELEQVDLYEYEEGEDIYYIDGQKISLETLAQDFAPATEQIARDLAALDNFESYKAYDAATKKLDNTSTLDYLKNLPTSDAVRKILEAVYTPEYGLEVAVQSSLNFIYLVAQEAGEFDPLAGSDERYYIKGGNQQIPNRLAKLLEENLETKVALEGIQMLSDGRYQVTVRTHANVYRDRTYDKVVLAVPLTVLQKIDLQVELPRLKKQAIAEFGYGTNAKIITRYGHKIWKDQYGSSGYSMSDTGYQITWESSQGTLTPDAALLTNFTGGRQGEAVGNESTPRATEQFLKTLEPIYPGITDVQIAGDSTKIHWSTVPYSYGSYGCYKVGQYTQFYGSLGEKVGNLYFAGEHTSLDHQGFMEGGCESGERVALEILEDMGLRPQANRQKAQFWGKMAARQGVRGVSYRLKVGGRRKQKRGQNS